MNKTLLKIVALAALIAFAQSADCTKPDEMKGCSSCVAAGDKCEPDGCMDGYYFMTDKCMACMTYCKKCTDATKCTMCMDGYKGNADMTKCEKDNMDNSSGYIYAGLGLLLTLLIFV